METNTIKRTGVIGLGAMGLQMARHMVRKGFDVTGYDVDADAMRRAIEQGAQTCLSPAQVGDHAEVVIVMVASDHQVEEVVAQSGLLDRLQPGAVICIASSCAPETCRRMEEIAAKRGIGVLDCPVVLGQEAANNGTADLLCRRRRALARPRPARAGGVQRPRAPSWPRGHGSDRQDHQQHAVVGVHGGQLRIAHASPRSSAPTSRA